MLTVFLSDDSAGKLQALAGAIKVASEDLARDILEDWLRRQDNQFVLAAAYVLKKNAELYRRLA